MTGLSNTLQLCTETANFDWDSFTDFVVANQGSSGVSFYFSDGKSGFKSRASYCADGDQSGITVIHGNGDSGLVDSKGRVIKLDKISSNTYRVFFLLRFLPAVRTRLPRISLAVRV